MTTGVISVGLSTFAEDIARTLLSNRISAVPVLDENGALVGIISEADLIHRIKTDVDGSELRSIDLMTSPVISAPSEMSLGELVALFDKHRIKRIPVVKNGKIVGIVSRADLLQAFVVLDTDMPVAKPQVMAA